MLDCVLLWLKKETSPCTEMVLMVPTPVKFYKAYPLSYPCRMYKMPMCMEAVIIHMKKKSLKATQSTKNKQSNPESHGLFFLLVLLISEKEYKQGLDASVSKRVCLHCGDEGP